MLRPSGQGEVVVPLSAPSPPSGKETFPSASNASTTVGASGPVAAMTKPPVRLQPTRLILRVGRDLLDGRQVVVATIAKGSERAVRILPRASPFCPKRKLPPVLDIVAMVDFEDSPSRVLGPGRRT